MDSKYSFDNINYSGITDVPSLVIQSSDLTIYNVNTSSALKPTDNVLYPMQQQNGSVTFEDIDGNLVYFNGSNHCISVNGTVYTLTYNSGWYYKNSSNQTVYLVDQYGERITSITDSLSKHEINASFTMTSQDGNTTLFTTTGTVAMQGNSATANTDIVKKSFKLKFADKVTIGQWAAQDSFSIKSYFADWTNCRDMVCQKVYEQMLILNGTRPNGSPVSDTSALCHIDGFPVRVYFIDSNSNRQYWGLYVFQNRKKRKTFGMNKSNLSQIAFEGDYDVLTMARELINPEDTLANYNSLRSTLSTFASTANLSARDDTSRDRVLSTFDLNNYLDIYLLFFLFLNWDSYSHNTIYATWDASKYFALPYDMDLTFGAWQIDGSRSNGAFINASDSSKDAFRIVGNPTPLIYSFLGDSSKGYSNYSYLYTLAKNRYRQLRTAGIFSVNNIIGLCKSLYFQTTGLSNAASLYAAHPEYLGMTGGEISSSDTQTVDNLYQDTNYRDFYYEDKVRWNWYRIYSSQITDTHTLYCGGVCNNYGGRESIGRMQDWITARIARGDTVFEYDPSESTAVRNMSFNSATVDTIKYNNQTLSSMNYNSNQIYSES